VGSRRMKLSELKNRISQRSEQQKSLSLATIPSQSQTDPYWGSRPHFRPQDYRGGDDGYVSPWTQAITAGRRVSPPQAMDRVSVKPVRDDVSYPCLGHQRPVDHFACSWDRCKCECHERNRPTVAHESGTVWVGQADGTVKRESTLPLTAIHSGEAEPEMI
jgi:hypothetical protein